MSARLAHPYRDLDVIDARAPRFNQAVIGTLALVAVLTGWWPLLGLLALQFALGLTLGRRFCLPCVAYFELVQPRLGEGELEDARAPRFANMIGLVVLTAATVASAAGLHDARLGARAARRGARPARRRHRLLHRLRDLPAGSALARHRPRRAAPRRPGRRRPRRRAPGDTVVQFTHPLCSECHTLERRLRDAGRAVVTVDVKLRPDLARKYGIGIVPTAVAVDAAGTVTARLA